MSRWRTLLSVLVLILMLTLTVVPTLAWEPLPKQVTAGDWDTDWEDMQPQGTIWYRGG
ncbi:MAG TPA: hypothetical protein PLQ56_10965 [Aggregatilineales bacterium]|nr:hypothetical protein [Anaerolineae bacterium]HUN07114.1 hypothetical protein [Aggregatilineales bacterium]